MSNSISVDRNPAFATMAAVAVHDSSRTITDDPHATNSAATDLHIKGTDTQPNDAAEASGCSTDNDLSTSSPKTSAKTSPETPGNPDPEAARSTAIESTVTIPTIYPPRPPNIFRARQKHLRYPAYGHGPVTPATADISTQELEETDGFPVADLQTWQAEIKDRMKKKTEMFVNMVRQSAWQGRRVEDLGEVFAIED